MAKRPSPLLGYNTNIRHNGKVYHVQTEDSGVQYSHLITHLFADGGRIVASTKTSYKQYVDTDGYPDAVKKMMQGQHKAMCLALKHGEYDEVLEVGGVKAEKPPSKRPSSPRTSQPKVESARPKPPSQPRITPSHVEALERAAAAKSAQSAVANRKTNLAGPGIYRHVTPVPERMNKRTPSSPANRRSSRPPISSIFGGDLVSEKSLDEVILSYLAADLDDTDS